MDAFRTVWPLATAVGAQPRRAMGAHLPRELLELVKQQRLDLLVHVKVAGHAHAVNEALPDAVAAAVHLLHKRALLLVCAHHHPSASPRQLFLPALTQVLLLRELVLKGVSFVGRSRARREEEGACWALGGGIERVPAECSSASSFVGDWASGVGAIVHSVGGDFEAGPRRT